MTSLAICVDCAWTATRGGNSRVKISPRPAGRNASRKGNMIFLFVAIVTVVLSGVVLTVATETTGRSGKWGINLNSVWDMAQGKGLLRKVTCTTCGREQAQRRMSLKFTEFLWGGWTCPDCGTVIDQW